MQADLLAGWAFAREWGCIGRCGRVRVASIRRRDKSPVQIRAGRGALDWINRQGHPGPLALDGLFLAA